MTRITKRIDTRVRYTAVTTPHEQPYRSTPEIILLLYLSHVQDASSLSCGVLVSSRPGGPTRPHASWIRPSLSPSPSDVSLLTLETAYL